ncbi:MAG: universal stress protein [Anaerolineae bacterium]|jgi:nucleotide-binding universal stress UspA family protein
MYERVLVLLDGSELAEQVLPHVAEIVRGRDIEVHLLSVAPVVMPPTAVVVDVYPIYMTADFMATQAAERERIGRELQEYLDGVVQRMRSVAGKVRTAIRSGRPAEEILQYAEEVGIDLIAMCTHGRSGLSRWVYGSVADRVLRGANCPVLLVRVHPTE